LPLTTPAQPLVIKTADKHMEDNAASKARRPGASRKLRNTLMITLNQRPKHKFVKQPPLSRLSAGRALPPLQQNLIADVDW
jgi:hypothetical protein